MIEAKIGSLVGRVARIETESSESAIERFYREEQERDAIFHGSGGLVCTEERLHHDARLWIIKFPRERTLVVLSRYRLGILPKVEKAERIHGDPYQKGHY